MDIGEVIRPIKSDVIRDHVFVVVSFPDAQTSEVVIVNFTTYDGHKDPACLLDQGDHPFIKHPTCIQYRDAKVVKEADLDLAVSNGLVTMLEAASDDLLRKIHAGAENSDEMPGKCYRVLQRQGLVG